MKTLFNAKKIMVFGATGLVGRELVRQLLDPDQPLEQQPQTVIAVCRRPVDASWWCSDPRLRVEVIQEAELRDPFHPQNGLTCWMTSLANLDWTDCDAVYCCVGTTIRKAGSQAAFWHVDVRLPEAIAAHSVNYGIKRFCAVSSVGASAKSIFFYPRAKAAMEQALAVSGLPMVHIVRPTLLLGDRTEYRTGERIATLISSRMEWLFHLGPLKKQKPIHAAQVARAMIGLIQTWPDVPVPAGFDPQPGAVFFHEATTLHS
jgi:uncharacterized protein YbjT (DUF2867 family)